MANLVPSPVFSDVFQLETSTQVLGGPGGVANRQAQELLNRTQWLYENLSNSGWIVATPAAYPGLDPTGSSVPAAIAANTAALQQFFDDCRGKRGYLPAGWYKKNAAINMDPRYSYHIEGAGWTSENTNAPPWGTVIEDTNDSFGIFIYYAWANFPGGPAGDVPPKPNSDNLVTLSHFRLRGPRVFTPPGNTSVGIEGVNTLTPKGTGIFAYWCQGLNLKNVWIDGYQGNGFYGYRCFSIVMEDVWTIKNNFSGIVLFKTANAVQLSRIKSLVNGRVASTSPHYNIIISSDVGNFASLGPVIEGPCDVSYCGNDGASPNYFSVAGTDLTNITVAAGVATANGTGFNFTAGQIIGVFGCTTQRAVNTLYPATILTASSTQLTWATSAPNGTYTDATLAIGPYADGIGLNHVYGARVNAYCEDPSGAGIYVGAGCESIEIDGGYYQDARILVDNGAKAISTKGVHYAGIRGGDHWAEASSIAVRSGSTYENLPGRGLAASSSGDALLQDDAALTVQGIYLGRGKGGNISNQMIGLGSGRNLNPSGGTNGQTNTAVGYQSGESLTTGYGNVFFGYRAGRAVDTGFQNIALGRNSLANWPNAQRVVTIGEEACANVISGGSEIAIGYRAGYHGSASNTNGQNVFIGDFAGAATAAQEYGTCVMIGFNNSASGIATGVTNYIGIGYATNNFAQTNTFRAGNTAITAAIVQVAWTISSDERLKSAVENLPTSLGLEFINSLRPVSYRRINGEAVTRTDREMGLIAQEVDSVTPAGYELVNIGPDGFYGLRYNDLITPIIKAIQQLDVRLTALEP